MKAAVRVTESKNAYGDNFAYVAASVDVKNLFKKELQTKYGHVMPFKDALKMFGVDHGLPVIDGVISIEAVSMKLAIMRDLALSSAM